jgi:hypothetical protein
MIKVGSNIKVVVPRLGVRGHQVRMALKRQKISVDLEEVRERKQHEPRVK